MRKNMMLATMCVVLAFGGVACSDSGGGGGDAVADLAKMMQKEQSGGDALTDKQATCMAEMTVDLLGEDVVNDALAAKDEEAAKAKIDDAMENLDPEKLGEAVTKMAECVPEMMDDLGGG